MFKTAHPMFKTAHPMFKRREETEEPMVTSDDMTQVDTKVTSTHPFQPIQYTEEPVDIVESTVTEVSESAGVPVETVPLPGPQDDPAYKRAKAITEAKMKRDAENAKRTLSCKSKNKPHDRSKQKAAKKAKKRNR